MLRTVAALPFLSAAIAGVQRTLRRARPADAAWPSQARWDQLKHDVGGNLIKVQPLFAACAAEPQGSACLEVLKNARNPFYLGDQPAGTQVSGWLDAWSPAAAVPKPLDMEPNPPLCTSPATPTVVQPPP